MVFVVEWQSTARGALISATLVTTEHLALWDVRLPLTWRYTIGMATVGVGITLAAMERRDWRTAVDFWAITGASGCIVAGLHFWREARGDKPREILAAREAGRILERLEGRTNGTARKR